MTGFPPLPPCCDLWLRIFWAAFVEWQGHVGVKETAQLQQKTDKFDTDLAREADPQR